jgi:hypothetical protein
VQHHLPQRKRVACSAQALNQCAACCYFRHCRTLRLSSSWQALRTRHCNVLACRCICPMPVECVLTACVAAAVCLCLHASIAHRRVGVRTRKKDRPSAAAAAAAAAAEKGEFFRKCCCFPIVCCQCYKCNYGALRPLWQPPCWSIASFCSSVAALQLQSHITILECGHLAPSRMCHATSFKQLRCEVNSQRSLSNKLDWALCFCSYTVLDLRPGQQSALENRVWAPTMNDAGKITYTSKACFLECCKALQPLRDSTGH